MKPYWQDKGARLVWRWILFVYACLLALWYVPSLPYDMFGVYHMLFISAVLAATCFGIGKRLGWLRLVIGLLPLLYATVCIGVNF